MASEPRPFVNRDDGLAPLRRWIGRSGGIRDAECLPASPVERSSCKIYRVRYFNTDWNIYNGTAPLFAVTEE
jgi:hypothetical protein